MDLYNNDDNNEINNLLGSWDLKTDISTKNSTSPFVQKL